MAAFIQLANTPIKEIIFTISFSENVGIDRIEAFKALPRIAQNYPVLNKGFNTQIVATQNQQPTSRISFDGYILRSPAPLSRIIQARRGSFSFHKVNGYEKFDLLMSELKEYWNLLVQCTGNLTVNNLAVRYVNFIEKTPDEKVNDLINIYTEQPFGEQLTSDLSQIRFNYPNNAEIIANVVTSKARQAGKEGIVLDIILNKRIRNGRDYELLFNSLTDMRAAKNDLFFKSVTEKTINKYNQ